MSTKKSGKGSLVEYYSALQLRTDRWTSLENACEGLARSQAARQKDRLKTKARDLLDALQPIELYWAFPGHLAFDRLHRLLVDERFADLARAVSRIVRALLSSSYRRRLHHNDLEDTTVEDEDELEERMLSHVQRPYFEVMIVDDLTPHQEEIQRQALRRTRRPDDRFDYEPVFVPSVEDALVGVHFNHDVQAVVVRSGLALESEHQLPMLSRYLNRVGDNALDDLELEDAGPELCRLIRKVRPEIDVYLVTDQSVEDIAGRDLGNCRRVFYNREDYLELHLNILRGVNSRYKTPFFDALREYARQPTGVFHAMPISRGKSITRSHWIQDMGEFYGMNIFLAETSATSGGLDSLLEPHGPIKKAQELAARAFGAKHTFFATNGTSTCNKIVVQAVVRPGDIVLVDRDCHKSHHYGMVLAGAQVVYLDSYPLHRYSMYGAVPLREIKHRLLELKDAGKLDRVRMLLLTNCTFDGVVYNVERVMEECLAIKPDLVFLWDEAWFGFARFGPTYRQRTAMNNARALARALQEPGYREAWKAHAREIEGADSQGTARTAAHARSGRRPRAGLCDAIDPQDAHRPASGLDDPCPRPGLQGRGRAGLSRGLYDPHLDLSQLPDHSVARCRPTPGRARRFRD